MADERDRPAAMAEQTKHTEENEYAFWVATAPSTARQRRVALAVVVATLVAYVAVIPFASIQLPQVNSFIPSLFSAIFVADLVTAVLLFAQFRTTGLHPLLVLACGYLYSSLIVVGHLLTYPGAFSPTGLLGAGPQSASWLNILWRSGLSVSFAGYAVLKLRNQPQAPVQGKSRSVIPWSVAIVVAVVGSLIFTVTAGHDLLPPLLSNGRITLTGRYAVAVVLITNLGALALLMSTRGRTILDVWLTVAAAALAAESAFILLVVQQRYDVSFYALRLIALPVSKMVLVVLLWETMRLYERLSVSNAELRRERANRLANAAEGLAAIAHEIRQPLAGINLSASAGQQMLDRTPPDIGAGRDLFAEIRSAALRANEVFGNVLRLFREGRYDHRPVDLNGLIREAARLQRKRLDEHNVTTFINLAPDLPLVSGHAGQLREVVLNLIQNSIDAMIYATGGPRSITIATSRCDAGEIAISLQDTGPGIEPQTLASIFDPFVTTKAQGTGLGLAICKMVIDQHGGRLTASSGETGGARFEITLPAWPADPDAPPASGVQGKPAQPVG